MGLLVSVPLYSQDQPADQTKAQAQPSASAPAQHDGASNSDEQEDARGVRTREFLGLGRMPDAKMAAEGEKTFQATCGFCHGANARGGSGPDLLRSPVVLDDNQGEMIGPVVHEGRAGKGMPAFPSLTAEQVRQIAEYLHLQVELAANRGTYQMLNVVTGDANRGKAFFDGEGKCSTCHSASGDLAHVGAKRKPADLQQTFLYPGRPAAVKVTVTLANSQVLDGTLKHLDDFYVSFYDAQGNFHSLPLGKGVSVKTEDKLAFHREMLDKYTNQQMHDLTAYLVTLK
jgi:cytochrome c oxidase cbb3-type subunit III